MLQEIKPIFTVLWYFLGFQSKDNHIIELRKNGIKFKVRDPMELWSVKETFLDRFYERFRTRIENGWTIIDIGGGIGEFTIFAAIDNPKNKVFAFEPFLESYNLLQENLKLNQIEQVQVFPEAVWGKTGTLVIDTSSGVPSKFCSKEKNSLNLEEAQLSIPAVTLADIFEKLNIVDCDLLKLDCEGAEYPILFGTPDTIFNQIKRIVLEYHENMSKFSQSNLSEFLRAKGFEVATVQNFVHEYLGYLYAYRANA